MKKNKRKTIGTIIGIILFMCCVTYFTYAFYQWRSDNSDVNLTIKDGRDGIVSCTSGPSVDVKNIGPVLNPSDGVKTSFSVKNTSSSDVTLTLGLKITSISNPLRVESFKYALYQDTTGSDQFDYDSDPILSGNFSKISVGDNTLSTTLTVEKESTYSFQFIVYIDGNMENNSAMMDSSLSSTITYGDCDDLTRYLSNAEPGSYVKYTGNNGCTGKACEGQNANYVSDTDMGYCAESDYKFNANGWRIAYVKNGSPYLISAGSPECMCTNSDGTAGTSCSSYESTNGVPKHMENLNTKALTYCNSTYAYGGKCNSNSAWNMNNNDFQTITGDSLSTASGKPRGYYLNYSFINNGGDYWFGGSSGPGASYALSWYQYYKHLHPLFTSFVGGIRPVLRLAPTIKITGGTGTYEDPYTIEKQITKLSEAEAGSYVKYTGNNGCTGKSCEGQNANYVDDTDMGYCRNAELKFNANGWRVAYVKDDTAYLTSAGSPECMCTDLSGNAGTNCSNYDRNGGLPSHIANLNAKALTYCNSTYAYGGICDSNSAWNMSDADFQIITGDSLEVASSNGYDYIKYPLLQNHSYYWFATPSSATAATAFYWGAYGNISRNNSSFENGIRPVLRLASSVKVTGGTGTYEDPYTITNAKPKLSEAEVGSYVKYTGNNGCTGKACEGQNANYVSDTNMGYCYNSDYKFNTNGWRVAYIKSGSAYLISAGSPECMCTSSDGTAGTSCGSYETTNEVPKHIANLNTKALTYCNSTYAYGGKCNNNSAWNINNNDFQYITEDNLNSAYNGVRGSYDRYPIINNGSLYWFANSSHYGSISANAFDWDPDYRTVYSVDSHFQLGIRPVLRLASSVEITGGNGTYEDPYVISNG